MLNPFRKHFWTHCWGPWSEPYDQPVAMVFRGQIISQGTLPYQRRTCRVCGRVEEREI